MAGPPPVPGPPIDPGPPVDPGPPDNTPQFRPFTVTMAQRDIVERQYTMEVVARNANEAEELASTYMTDRSIDDNIAGVRRSGIERRYVDHVWVGTDAL